MKREKTKFPGVHFVWGTGVDGKPEKTFYIRYPYEPEIHPIF